jgi:hypothetical protein
VELPLATFRIYLLKSEGHQVIPVVLSHNADIVILAYMLAQFFFLFFVLKKLRPVYLMEIVASMGAYCCSVHRAHKKTHCLMSILIVSTILASQHDLADLARPARQSCNLGGRDKHQI